MKIVAILGSPRGMKGNTGILLEGVLQGVREAGAEVQTFSLDKVDVQPCRSCECCHISGECPISDDFDVIKAAITEADGLVLASPNYIMSVTAQLKALLDRFSGPIHTQEFDGKYAAAVVTSGSEDSSMVEKYLLSAMRMTGFTTVGSVGALGFAMTQPAMRTPYLATATALGTRLVEAIRNREHFPEQDTERNMIRERMQKLVTMMKDHWPYEYNLWMERCEG